MIYNTLNLETASDEELKQAAEETGRLLMYYMAAEGNYSSEAKERGAVKKKYYEIVSECEKRNIDIVFNGRDHSFSSSSLRKRVYDSEATKRGQA